MMDYMQQMLADAAKNAIPVEICLELTHKCNFRCQHCYIPDFSAPDLLSTERIYELFDELAELGTLYLTLTGGEMFLRKDWLQIATRARERGFSIRMFTNGSTVTEEIADAVIPLNSTVEVSLYSMDPEIFDKITQRPGSFDKTIRGIEMLRERDVAVALKIPMMTYNTQGFEKVFEYAQSVGADCRADSKIVAKKDGDLVTIQLRADEQELTPLYRGGWTPCSVPQEYDGDIRREGPMCAAANRYANITSAGDVMACNILPGSAGNIREKSFREVWEESAWLKQIRAIRRKDLDVCSSCDKWSYCGRCHAQAMVEDGNLMGPSSWACGHAEAIENLHAPAVAAEQNQKKQEALVEIQAIDR